MDVFPHVTHVVLTSYSIYMRSKFKVKYLFVFKLDIYTNVNLYMNIASAII